MMNNAQQPKEMISLPPKAANQYTNPIWTSIITTAAMLHTLLDVEKRKPDQNPKNERRMNTQPIVKPNGITTVRIHPDSSLISALARMMHARNGSVQSILVLGAAWD